MMHDFNSIDIAADPIKICITLQGHPERESAGSQSRENFVTLEIPGQLNEVVPLTPVNIFVKEEQLVYCKTEEPELVSLVPVLPKPEHVVYCKTEEPELVSLVPVLPKPEHVENSSSEDWSNHSDPLAVEQNVASASYVEYVETNEPILMELGTSSTEGLTDCLRVTQESSCTVENGEVYDLTGSDGVISVSESAETSSHGDTDGDCVAITDMSCVAAEVHHCSYCGEGFATEGEMQVHALSHARRAPVWCEVLEAKRKQKSGHVPETRHTCGDCGEEFERLEHLMRHRLGHIRAALRKPFGTSKLFSSPKPSGALKQSNVPEPQVSASPSSRHTAGAISKRTSPKRSPQRVTASPQPKRWTLRKKARRRRVS